MKRAALAWLQAFGCDPLATWRALRGLAPALGDFRRFRRALGPDGRAAWPTRFEAPCLSDRCAASGSASGHYFHQDLWVARRVFERQPQRHIDVGSSVSGLVAHLAVFREVEVFDIRPQPSVVRNIRFRQRDMMAPAPEDDACCDSVSCLHALEHFGLGRYGDPVDPDGYRRGFAALVRLLRPGGHLYLSVPVGSRQRVAFNGHRIFAPRTILELASGCCDLAAFAWVDDAGRLHDDGVPGEARIGKDVAYGCGIFEFCRRGTAGEVQT